MKDIKNLTESEIKERLKKMEQPAKFDVLRAVMAVQEAVNGMSHEDKELVLSMWTHNILSYDRILALVENKA